MNTFTKTITTIFIGLLLNIPHLTANYTINDVVKAIENGDIKTVEKGLAQKSIDVNTVIKSPEECSTLLTTAIVNKQEQIATLLIGTKGIDLEKRYETALYGQGASHTPLTLAITYGLTKIAKLLVQKKANIEAQAITEMTWIGTVYQTALGVAAEMGNTAMVNFLIDKGAHVNVGTKKYVCYDKNDEVVKNKFVETTCYPLNVAAAKGDIESVTLLLEHGADIHAGYAEEGNFTFYRTQDETPLTVACAGNHTSVVQLLLSKGALVKNHTQPLFMAIMIGNIAIAKLLIAYGININQPFTFEGYTFTPLIIAAKTGNKEMVQLLLDKGASNPSKKSAAALVKEHQQSAQ